MSPGHTRRLLWAQSAVSGRSGHSRRPPSSSRRMSSAAARRVERGLHLVKDSFLCCKLRRVIMMGTAGRWMTDIFARRCLRTGKCLKRSRNLSITILEASGHARRGPCRHSACFPGSPRLPVREESGLMVRCRLHRSRLCQVLSLRHKACGRASVSTGGRRRGFSGNQRELPRRDRAHSADRLLHAGR
jgi:hypothetical protein